jgi:predicted transcriptional regulator
VIQKKLIFSLTMTDELKDIDLGESYIQVGDDGVWNLFLDKRVPKRSRYYIFYYIYQEETDDLDKQPEEIIREVREAAKFLHLKRLEQICGNYLDKTIQITEKGNKFLENLEWAYNNLRSGKYDLTDFQFVCKDNKIVRCHACVLVAASKYFDTLLASGSVQSEEKKKMEIVVEETEQQIQTVLRYIYTRQLVEFKMEDIVPIWILANKFMLEDLLLDCEAIILRNISKDNAADIKKIAEMFKTSDMSERLISVCNKHIQ